MRKIELLWSAALAAGLCAAPAMAQATSYDCINGEVVIEEYETID